VSRTESVSAFPLLLKIRNKTAIFSTYLELTKPRLTMLAVLTALLGYYLGVRGGVNFLRLCNVFFGAVMVGGGANVLNQFFERDTDAMMRRTEGRPLPSGRLNEEQAFNLGLFLSVSGALWYVFLVNVISGVIALVTLVSYLIFYTPLKKKTMLALFVGAIPGALPPVMGWVAATGSLSVEAGVLFAILFFWQVPHFLAIGWMCREDYQRAGIPVMSAADPDGRKTAQRMVFYCAILLAVSVLPWILGLAGGFYLASALILGGTFLGMALMGAKWDRTRYARRLFFASIIYLPLLMIFMALNKN